MLRKRIVSSLMGLLLVGSVVTVGYSQGVGDLCNENGDFGADHDTCVTCLNSGEGNVAACFCKAYGDLYGYPVFGYKNQGDCISDLNPGN